MKVILLTVLFTLSQGYAQPRMELEPQGFAPIEADIPVTPTEKLIALTKSWAQEYNRRERGFDITNVTDNSLTISAYKDDAFYYRSRGETFEHAIRYTMSITFYGGIYRLTFAVNDIYADEDKLIESKIPDFFNANGKIKEGYTDLEVSLEDTVNDIVKAYHNYIVNYR